MYMRIYLILVSYYVLLHVLVVILMCECECECESENKIKEFLLTVYEYAYAYTPRRPGGPKEGGVLKCGYQNARKLTGQETTTRTAYM